MSNITQRHLQKMDVVYYRKGISGCSDIGTLSVPGLIENMLHTTPTVNQVNYDVTDSWHTYMTSWPQSGSSWRVRVTSFKWRRG